MMIFFFSTTMRVIIFLIVNKCTSENNNIIHSFVRRGNYTLLEQIRKHSDDYNYNNRRKVQFCVKTRYNFLFSEIPSEQKTDKYSNFRIMVLIKWRNEISKIESSL